MMNGTYDWPGLRGEKLRRIVFVNIEHFQSDFVKIQPTGKVQDGV